MVAESVDGDGVRVCDALMQPQAALDTSLSDEPASPREQVVVVGGGFAGFHALRYLHRHLPPDRADLVLVNPTDYLLYSPLLPEVATGVVEARHIAVSLPRGPPPRAPGPRPVHAVGPA